MSSSLWREWLEAGSNWRQDDVTSPGPADHAVHPLDDLYLPIFLDPLPRGCPGWGFLETNRPSLTPADGKRRLYIRGPALTVLWVRFPVGARSSHTKDFKNGSGPY